MTVSGAAPSRLATALLLLGLVLSPACGGQSGGAVDAAPRGDARDGGISDATADAPPRVDAGANRWDEMKWDEGRWQ